MPRAAAHPALPPPAPSTRRLQPVSILSPTLRVRPTHRGLQVTDHRANPPELIGAIFPWLNIAPGNGDAIAWHDNGQPVVRNGRRVRLLLGSDRQRRVVSRAAAAAVRRAWRLGTLDVHFEPDGAHEPTTLEAAVLTTAVFLLPVACTAGLALIVAGIWRTGGLAGQQLWWLAWMTIGALALTAAWRASALSAARHIWSQRTGARTTCLAAMTKHDIVLIDAPTGRERCLPWNELRRVEGSPWSPRLIFVDGTLVDLPPDRRARQIAALAWDSRGHEPPLFDILIDRFARRMAAMALVLGLIVAPPALTGPFAANPQGPMQTVPVVLAIIAIALLIDRAPALLRLLRCQAHKRAPRLSRRFLRPQWAPG